MKLFWSDLALEDLESLRAYVSEDSPSNARQLMARIKASLKGLEDFPRRGRTLPEAPNFPHVRELIVEGYRIVYRVDEHLLAVLAVIHSSRDISRLRPWKAP